MVEKRMKGVRLNLTSKAYWIVIREYQLVHSTRMPLVGRRRKTFGTTVKLK